MYDNFTGSVMDQDKIKQTISAFSGNINSAFMLIEGLNGKLDFELDFNFDSSTALQRFTNLVRNMIQKGIIDKPVKSGRTLILDERSILQLLVGRKYLGAGCSMNSLEGYLANMPTDELYDRLFTKQLPDIEKLARRSQQPYLLPNDTETFPCKIDKYERNFPLYHYIKIKPDFHLHIKSGKYSANEINDIVNLIENYFENQQSTIISNFQNRPEENNKIQRGEE